MHSPVDPPGSIPTITHQTPIHREAMVELALRNGAESFAAILLRRYDALTAHGDVFVIGLDTATNEISIYRAS